MVDSEHAVACIIAQRRWSIVSCAIPDSVGERPGSREKTMPLTDRTLYCRDCNQAFVFTTGEQEFYASRGLMTPSRCPSCRAIRKGPSGDRSSRDSSGHRSGFREARQMYTITCASCGKEAQVPFQPRDDRPVYCSSCYRSQGAGPTSGRRSRWSSS